MELDYENKINLAFDKPLKYKEILLYPATLSYYILFAEAEECLDISRMYERDIQLLRLSYLDYLYEKSLTDTVYKARWNMLLYILRVVLGDEQPFEIIREEGHIYIKVYQKSKDYEEIMNEIEDLKNNLPVDDRAIATREIILNIIEKKKEKLYNTIQINSSEFDDIRKLIMVQNDIKSQHYDAKTEELLNNMRKKLNAVNNSNKKIDFEDLVTIVSYSINKEPIELENMPIRRFNRLLNIVLRKDDYYLYKHLELSGNIKPKSEIPHWISHFEPKGKYDDIIVEGNGLMSSIQDGGKI